MPAAQSPVSHLEIPLKDPNQEVLIDPANRLKTPDLSELELSPISAVGTLKPVSSSSKKKKKPFAAKVKRRFRFPDFTYEYNQWDLSVEGREALSLVAEELRNETNYFILSIEGHTDDVGSETYNQELSFKRAVAAATHLVLHDGLDPARIFVKGFGESVPVAGNETEKGRAKNRRVELLILVPEGYEDAEAPARRQGHLLPLSGEGNASIMNGAPVDALTIEEAIMDKTGAKTAEPAGTFSHIDTVEKKEQTQ